MKLEFTYKQGWASLNKIQLKLIDGRWSYSGFVATSQRGQTFISRNNFSNKNQALIDGLRWMLKFHNGNSNDMSKSISRQINDKIKTLSPVNKQLTLF